MSRPKIDLEKRVRLFILVRLLNKSNRMTQNILSCLEPFTGLKINYKYIEQLYNDPEIKLILYNVFVFD
ncbi:MAG: hypothetical protein LBQ98_07665 [Nitrososphaerota archaeon]|nr:hypothetical protein [Nitrososphaerota archaeon]